MRFAFEAIVHCAEEFDIQKCLSARGVLLPLPSNASKPDCVSVACPCVVVTSRNMRAAPVRLRKVPCHATKFPPQVLLYSLSRRARFLPLII